MSDEVIRDLCLMYGAGYTGKVHIMYNAGSQITDLDQFALLSAMNAAKKGTLDHVKIPQRPFSDMLIKDEDGISHGDKISGNDGSFKVERGGIWVDFYSTKRQIDSSLTMTLYPDGTIEGEAVDSREIAAFMHEHGYWIPKSLIN